MGLFKKLKKAFGGSSNPSKEPEPAPANKAQPVSAPPPAAASKPAEEQGANVSFQMPNLTEEQMEKVFGPVAQGATEVGMSVKDYMKEKNVNSFNDSLDHLDENGDLPFGWYAKNHDLIQMWEPPIPDYATSSRQIDLPIDERIEILEKMMAHLHAFQDDFNARGECFQKYFYDSWVANGYFKQWEDELADLKKNRDTIFARQEAYRKERPGLEERLFRLLKENDGILQKNTYKEFHPCVKQDIQSLLYEWEKSGKIQRTKQGNTYVVHIV